VRLVQVDVMEHGANAAYVVHDEDQVGL